MPLSNVLEWMIELTASLISAVSSMMTGCCPRRRPAPVCRRNSRRLHHAGAAGGEIYLVHQFARQLQTREFDAADDAFRRALDRRLVDDARGLRRALLGARVGADEDGVARLEAQQRLENRRGGPGSWSE